MMLEVVPSVASSNNNSASRSRLVSHPRQVFMHQSGAAKPTCSRVSRDAPVDPLEVMNVTIVGLPGAPPECHVNTSFFGASISKNSPSRVKGTPLPVPTARQRPPTRTSPAQSLVLNTPGLIHRGPGFTWGSTPNGAGSDLPTRSPEDARGRLAATFDTANARPLPQELPPVGVQRGTICKPACWIWRNE